jgi:hypothetical protein
MKGQHGAHTCNPSYTRGIDRSTVGPKLAKAKCVRPYLKNSLKKHKGLGGRAQMVKRLLSKNKTLSSNSSTAKGVKKDLDSDR